MGGNVAVVTRVAGWSGPFKKVRGNPALVKLLATPSVSVPIQSIYVRTNNPYRSPHIRWAVA